VSDAATSTQTTLQELYRVSKSDVNLFRDRTRYVALRYGSARHRNTTQCTASGVKEALLLFDDVVVYPLRVTLLVENDAPSSEIMPAVFKALVQRRMIAAIRSARISCKITPHADLILSNQKYCPRGRSRAVLSLNSIGPTPTATPTRTSSQLCRQKCVT